MLCYQVTTTIFVGCYISHWDLYTREIPNTYATAKARRLHLLGIVVMHYGVGMHRYVVLDAHRKDTWMWPDAASITSLPLCPRKISVACGEYLNIVFCTSFTCDLENDEEQFCTPWRRRWARQQQGDVVSWAFLTMWRKAFWRMTVLGERSWWLHWIY